MEDDEHYVDDPKNPQFHHHGGEYAYQGGNSGGDFEGEGFQGEHEGYEASGNRRTIDASTLSSVSCLPTKLLNLWLLLHFILHKTKNFNCICYTSFSALALLASTHMQLVVP